MCHIARLIVILILAVQTCTADQQNTDLSQELLKTKQEYITLSVFVQPPKGTSRSDLEKVYGEPTQYVKKAKGPAPYFVYDLRTSAVNLVVQYEDGNVKWSRVKALPLSDGIGRQPLDVDMIKVYTTGISRLKTVRTNLWEKLRQAPWNKR